MKAWLALLTLTVSISLLPAQSAMAGENLRTALSQKWKQIQACQQSQNKKFKALEREAEQMCGYSDSYRGSSHTSTSNSRHRRGR